MQTCISMLLLKLIFIVSNPNNISIYTFPFDEIFTEVGLTHLPEFSYNIGLTRLVLYAIINRSYAVDTVKAKLLL